MQTIKVLIPKDGKVSIFVNGVSGSSCKELTRNLEEALGKVSSDEPTMEMYARPETQTLNQ
jgi:hypothetical protein